MSRSVSTHNNAVATAYLQLQPEDPQDSQWEWDNFVDSVTSTIADHYSSFSECDRWAGREDHVLLENGLAEVSVSEYNSIVAVCLAPRDANRPLDTAWCQQNGAKFEKLLQEAFEGSALISQGGASNGEQFFTLASVPGSVLTSKEGRLPMFP